MKNMKTIQLGRLDIETWDWTVSKIAWKDFVHVLLFLDLRNAFDTVNHQVLLLNLNDMVSETRLSYGLNHILPDRVLQTKVNDVRSPSMPLSCGVPQGSILGPLFFMIYVNNLSTCISH